MRMRKTACLSLSLLAGVLAGVWMTGGVPAAAAGPLSGYTLGRSTGYPIPRFVSLKSKKARMRVGPSTNYSILWIYQRAGTPLEIIGEWGNWRRVRDGAGTSGWMHAALLSGRRTAVVAPWLKTNVPLVRGPARASGENARMQPGVLLDIRGCDGSWCRVATRRQAIGGYVAQDKLWGVYPGETIE